MDDDLDETGSYTATYETNLTSTNHNKNSTCGPLDDVVVNVCFEEIVTPRNRYHTPQAAVSAASSQQQHRRVLSTGDLPDAAVLARCNSMPFLSLQLPDFASFDVGAAAEDNEDDEEASVAASTAYFDPVDFDRSTWKLVLDNASAFGLVVVALATVMTHPLLFLAGAVAAVGAARHHGYDSYFIERGKNFLCLEGGTIAPARMPPAIIAMSEEVQLGSEDESESSVYLNKSDVEEPKADDSTAECSSTGSPGVVPASSTTSAGLDTDGPVLKRNTTKQLSLADLADRKRWIAQHYKPLKHTVMEHGGNFVGLNVAEFFSVFFDDDAPYNFRVVQEKRGDVDIEYSHWEHLPEQGALSMLQSPDTLNFPPNFTYRSFQGRTLQFRAKTNSFLGPPYATTCRKQRILIVDKSLAILEMKTILSDIPFCDRFFVMERWVVTAAKVDGRYVTHVTTSCEPIFTQSCPFEQQIKIKSTSTIHDVVHSWCSMATAALALTERAKLHRLRQTTQDDDDTECQADTLVAPAVTDSCSDIDDNAVEIIVGSSQARRLGINQDYLLTSQSPRAVIIRSFMQPVPQPKKKFKSTIRHTLSQLTLSNKRKILA